MADHAPLRATRAVNGPARAPVLGPARGPSALRIFGLAALAIVGVMATACTRHVVVEQALEPGDAVVVVAGLEDPSTMIARLASVDEGGTAEIAVDSDTQVALLPVYARDLVDADGAPLSPSALTVDLAGDGPCGCTAPMITSPHVFMPGDRCAYDLGGAVELWPAGEGDLTTSMGVLDARLRLVAPGACAACPSPGARGPASSPEVCVLGEGAERQHPDRLTVMPDHTLVAVDRGTLVRVDARGVREEQALSPVLPRVQALAPLPGGDLLVVSSHSGAVGIAQGAMLRFSPAGGPEEVVGYPTRYFTSGVLLSAAPDTLWVYGRIRGGSDRIPALSRCALGPRGARVDCTELELPFSLDCRHYAAVSTIAAVTELPGGDLVAITSAGGVVSVPAGRDRATCMPGSAPPLLRLPSGYTTIDVDDVSLVRIGRRVVACMSDGGGASGYAVVLTATIGSLDPPAPLEWSVAHVVESRGVDCGAAFVDPRRPDRAQVILEDLRQSTVEVDALGRASVHGPLHERYPELDERIDDVTVAQDTLVLSTITGRVWTQTATQAAPVPRVVRSPGVSAAAGAVEATAAGFRLHLGAGAAQELRRTDASCASIVRGPRPSEVEGVVDDVIVPLDAGRLVFGRRQAQVVVERWGADDVRQSVLALEGTDEARRAVRVVGDWALMVSADGVLWATDGREARVLGASGWRDVDAASGVGWAFGEAGLGRALQARGGGLRWEPGVLEAADGAAVAAFQRRRPEQPDAVGARCDGSVLVAYDESPQDIARYSSDTTLWWLRARGPRLTFESYVDFDVSSPWAIDSPENVELITGPPDMPVIFGASGAFVASLVVGGAPLSVLPMRRPRSVAVRGNDLLVSGDGGRLAWIRLR